MQMIMRTWYIGYSLKTYLVFTVGTSVRTSMPTIYVGRLTWMKGATTYGFNDDNAQVVDVRSLCFPRLLPLFNDTLS